MELQAYQEEVSDEPLVDVAAIVPGKVVKEETGAFLKALSGLCPTESLL